MKKLDQMTINVTFYDLYKYIQNAEVDEFGVHQITGAEDYTLHIYSNKMQVNICKNGVSIGNIIFDSISGNSPTEVHLYKVDNGIADYDNAVVIDVMTTIMDTDPFSESIDWFRFFGKHGREIKKVLRFVLS